VHPENLFAYHRATLKLLFVGCLSLAMLIPLAMVRSFVSERQNLQLEAERTIANHSISLPMVYKRAMIP
jgi:inner membrane protein involved in colicin E2 resistance